MSVITEAAEQYSNQLWRLNNLYWIINRTGRKIKLQLNTAQENLYHEMWYRNVILKARQRGFTTFIDIFGLDSCLFNPNFKTGIIAQTLPDSTEIFRTKVKFPYENLPDGIKQAVPARNDKTNEYIFNNNSMVSVSNSFRSGTLQLLHVSEFGKIASKDPQKAIEIQTGAFESVSKDGIICVESTAEGQGGAFYTMVNKAKAKLAEGSKLSRFDMKFIFDAWHDNPDNILDDEVSIDSENIKYFQRLDDDYGITLKEKQKWWYVSKRNTLDDQMKKENPSYPDEAFEVAIEGAIYASQMARARKEGRILNIPIATGVEVHTFWDLGKSDLMSVWFMQQVGNECRWIDFYENNMEDIEHYCKMIKDKDYLYGKHYMPHDVDIQLLGMVKSRKVQFEDGGVRPIVKVDRIPLLIDGIQMVRQDFSTYYFDKVRCSQGIKNLDNYQWKWNKTTAQWMDDHVHNWASHGCDALRQKAQAYENHKNAARIRINQQSEF